LPNLFNRIALILIGLTANYPVKLIGVLKGGEILALLIVVFNFVGFINLFKKYKGFRVYSLLMLLWLVLAVISSYTNNASPIGFYKGFANVIVTYVSTTVFMLLLQKDFKDVVYFLIPYGLATIVFSPFSYSTEDTKSFLDLGRDFDNLNFFDIYISPVITPFLIGLAITMRGRQRLYSLLLLIFGLTAIIFDAKASGFVFFFASIILYVKLFGVKLTGQKIRFALFTGIILIFPLIIVLAKYDLLGKSSSNQVLLYIDGTKVFNPFLVISRPEPSIGLLAIADQPLLGHGFNKDDDKYYTIAKVIGIVPKDFYQRYKGIPAHSNLLISMIEGGVFAGFVWIFILIMAFKMFLIVLRMRFEPMTLYYIVAFMYLFWNVLFSGTLRLDIGHFISLLIMGLNKIEPKK
jgi:hypothetical protein